MENIQETSKKVDLTRLNRHERRSIQARNGIKIPGRNMPYIKKIHKCFADYYAKRDKEIENEIKQLEEHENNRT